MYLRPTFFYIKRSRISFIVVSLRLRSTLFRVIPISFADRLNSSSERYFEAWSSIVLTGLFVQVHISRIWDQSPVPAPIHFYLTLSSQPPQYCLWSIGNCPVLCRHEKLHFHASILLSWRFDLWLNHQLVLLTTAHPRCIPSLKCNHRNSTYADHTHREWLRWPFLA